MQVIFIIFLSPWGYNSLDESTRQHGVWKKILLQADPIESLTACVLAASTKQNSTIQHIRPNLLRKWPKWNCLVNMIMTVLDYTIYWFSYTVLLELAGGLWFCHIIINEIKCFNKVEIFIIFIFVLMIYTYKLFKHSHLQVKSSVCQQSTDWMHIKFIGPLNCWGGGCNYYLFFIDLVSTNILLAILGFPLSPKRHADFCFKPSWLFF